MIEFTTHLLPVPLSLSMGIGTELQRIVTLVFLEARSLVEEEPLAEVALASTAAAMWVLLLVVLVADVLH